MLIYHSKYGCHSKSGRRSTIRIPDMSGSPLYSSFTFPAAQNILEGPSKNPIADFVVEAKKFTDLFYKRILGQAPELWKVAPLINNERELDMAIQIRDYLNNAIECKSSKMRTAKLGSNPTRVTTMMTQSVKGPKEPGNRYRNV